ncbi:MAG: hypothetical protein AB9869_12530 [Verrucomicrobiia bacterium]
MTDFVADLVRKSKNPDVPLRVANPTPNDGFQPGAELISGSQADDSVITRSSPGPDRVTTGFCPCRAGRFVVAREPRAPLCSALG